jgi:hypothetical protein
VRSSGWSGAGVGTLPIVGGNPVKFLPIASNGTTAVTLVSASASLTIYPITIVFNNRGSVKHTVDIITSTGPAIIFEIDVAPQSSFVMSFVGDVRTLAGDGLQVKIDAGGSATDLNLNGWVLQQ